MKIKFEMEPGEEEAAAHFMSWLDGQGEQDYWQWMEIRESEQDGPITIVQFDYVDDHVTCEVGRLESE